MRPRSDIFATHRALASALAELAPVYRERAVETVAGALTEGRREPLVALRSVLDDVDLARARLQASRLRRARDVAIFDRAVRRGKVAVVSFSRWIATIETWVTDHLRPSRRNK